MELITTDENRYVDVGSDAIWQAVYSTVAYNLNEEKKELSLAFDFLKNGKCKAKKAEETARQINLVRDALSQYSPECVVFDLKNPDKKAPWGDDISPIITSCGNYFLTADGKDLLFELVAILIYASIKKVDVKTVK